jgi:predicted dehydrogenase
MEFSRRDFIKTASIAAAGAFIPKGSVTASDSVWASNSNTLKVGLIGCGGRGTGAAEEALNADPNVILVAMADAFDDQLEESYGKLKGKFAQRVQIPAGSKYAGLDAYQKLIDSDVDVVLLAAPPAFRPAHLEYAVNAGKHVFCEKPFAVDAPGLRRVIVAAREASEKNISLVSGFCWRYHLPKRETFTRLLDGQIGKILTAEATYDTGELWYRERRSGWSDMEYKLRNWLYYNWLSGDHIVEQAIHSLDMLQWGMGDVTPVRVGGTGGRQKRTDPKYGNIFDHFALVYEYADGAKAYFSCRQQANTTPSYAVEFTGKDGKCIIDCRTGLHQIKGKNPWKYDDETKFTDENAYKKSEARSMYQQEHDELFASVRSGRPINDGEWMVRSNLIALAGRTAGYTGQTISCEQALCATETYFPEPVSWDTQYDIPVAIPGITRYK